jgi:hypothetical protein
MPYLAYLHAYLFVLKSRRFKESRTVLSLNRSSNKVSNEGIGEILAALHPLSVKSVDNQTNKTIPLNIYIYIYTYTFGCATFLDLTEIAIFSIPDR